MSAINTTSINGNYPQAGVNNNTKGFRDNFGAIKSNLNIAKLEITSLETNVSALQTAVGSIQDPDLSEVLTSVTGSNAISATSTKTFTSYVTGLRFQFRPVAANTSTTVTININNKGAKGIKMSGGGAIPANILNTNTWATIEYDGVDFVLISGQSFSQAGNNAVLRTAQSKMRDFITVLDFGAVADGAFAQGGTPSGTDNLAAFNAALSAAVSTGITRVRVPGGLYYLSGKLIIPRSVILEGDGTTHLPILLQNSIKRGTCLLINGSSSNDCLALEENSGHSGLRDISVCNTNNNPIRSVVAVVGHLYAKLENVEIASLRPTAGVGLYIAPSSTGAFETLWGTFQNVVVTVFNIGTANEASVRWGLSIYGLESGSKVPNANSFVSGQFTGVYGALLMDGAASNTGALSCVFHGVKFDLNYKTTDTYTPVFKANANKVYGWLKNNCYIIPVIQLQRAVAAAFHGCYFEAAGQPATFNDGVNGSAPLIPVVWLDSATQVVDTGIMDSDWNGVYLYDAGARTHVSPTTSGHTHSTRYTPYVQVRLTTGGGQSISNAEWTKVQYNSVVSGDDSELEWDATNYKAVIRSDGTYTINAQVSYDGWAVGSGTFGEIRLNVDGLGSGTYNLRGTQAPASFLGIAVTAQFNMTVRLFAGDTVWIETFHNRGTAATLFANATYLSVTKI